MFLVMSFLILNTKKIKKLEKIGLKKQAQVQFQKTNDKSFKKQNSKNFELIEGDITKSLPKYIKKTLI